MRIKMSEEIKEEIKCNHRNIFARLRGDPNIGGVIESACRDCGQKLSTISTILNKEDFDRVHQIFALSEVGQNTINFFAFMTATVLPIIKNNQPRIIRP